MKIAILGSAPSSIGKAPFGDPSWEIWACSPGAYPRLGRVNEFFEIHRWEPGVVGKADTQKPWFTPEYVQWLGTVPPRVWVADPEAGRALPNSSPLPVEELVAKYGHYVWTSTVAYMVAMAIEKIRAARVRREEAARAYAIERQRKVDAGEPLNEAAALVETDAIGFFGIDMAANEELYSGQRSACQFFIQVIVGLKIEFVIPPESDLAVPPPMYGVSETNHRAIKLMERRRELDARLAQTNAQLRMLEGQSNFLTGAIDDLDYMQKMWLHEGDSIAFDFEALFPELAEGRAARAEKLVVKSTPMPGEPDYVGAAKEAVAAASGPSVISTGADLGQTQAAIDLLPKAFRNEKQAATVAGKVTAKFGKADVPTVLEAALARVPKSARKKR